MARLDIDFVLLDESVVDYGYRCLMSGAELEDFKANPVMLLMHLRANEGYDKPKTDLALPIGKWYDIRVIGSQLLAKPDFDDDDELAVRVQKKVQKGYMNAASIWVVPITVSDDDALKLRGQYGPTMTKWTVREGSIVDVPGCRNAIAIRNAAGKLLKLSSKDTTNQQEVLDYLNSLLPKKNNSDMDKKLLAARLGLPETATDAEIDAKLTATITAATPNTKLAADNAELKKKVDDLEKAQKAEKEAKLVDDGIAAKKLAAGDRDKYLKLAAADYDTTKSLIDSMQSYVSIEQRLAGQNGNSDADALELAELMKLSGRDLYMHGKFSRLQKLSAEGFKAKYKEYFGTEPKEQK